MSQKTPSPTGEEEHTTEETNPPQTTKRGPETADPAHPHTTGTHQAHQKRGKTNGIDFWHAVEFSRIRRAPHQAFRPSVGATVRTYPVCVFGVNFASGLPSREVRDPSGPREDS